MDFGRYSFVTFTVTIADPAVFTATAHELAIGDEIYLETTDSLPTGLSVKTPYFVVYNGIGANTFQVATSRGGTPVVTTGSQSGTHTYLKRNNARLRPADEDNR